MTIRQVFAPRADVTFQPLQVVSPRHLAPVSLTATPANTDPAADDEVYLMTSDVALHVAVGPDVVASGNHLRLAAQGAPYHVLLKPGDRLSVVKSPGEADGTLWLARAATIG